MAPQQWMLGDPDNAHVMYGKNKKAISTSSSLCSCPLPSLSYLLFSLSSLLPTPFFFSQPVPPSPLLSCKTIRGVDTAEEGDGSEGICLDCYRNFHIIYEMINDRNDINSSSDFIVLISNRISSMLKNIVSRPNNVVSRLNLHRFDVKMALFLCRNDIKSRPI